MKAILVVDVEEHGDYYADVYRKDADDRFEGRYYLKPLPQKLEVKVDTFDDIMHTEFQMTDVIADKLIANIRFETDKLVALGYNACLEEITGETE